MTRQQPTDITKFDQQQITNLQETLDDMSANGVRIRYESFIPTVSTIQENEVVVYDDNSGLRRLYSITREGNLLCLDEDKFTGATAGGDLTGTYPNPTLAAGVSGALAGWNVGGTTSPGSIYIHAGSRYMSSSTETISGLPFSSASSYHVTVTRHNATGYTSQAMSVNRISGSSFYIYDFTTGTTAMWIAIGT